MKEAAGARGSFIWPVNTARRLLAACLPVILLAGCRPGNEPEAERPPAPEAEWYEQTRDLYYGIPVTLRFAPAHRELAARAWACLERVDDLFNDFRADSEVGRINAASMEAKLAGGKTDGQCSFASFAVSEDLAKALRLARELHRGTEGAFDVTLGPVRRLWREAEKTNCFPAGKHIEDALRLCGMGKVKLEGRRLSAPAGMSFDFGGLIKGVAVDQVIRLLRRGGARAALVQVGGETAVFGYSPRGDRHVLGIQHPTEMASLWTTLRDPGGGLSVSTSGNYRAGIRVGDRVFYHIFDPRTGQPVDTRVLSVTVAFRGTGRNGVADGLATAGAVLGPERFLKLLRDFGGEALALVQEADGIRALQSPGWEKLTGKE